MEIGNPDEVPLDIAILFDVSSSVSQKGFFAFQQQCGSEFSETGAQAGRSRGSVYYYRSAEAGFTAGSAEIAAAKLLTIPAATTPVPTAFYDTVIAAAKYLRTNRWSAIVR